MTTNSYVVTSMLSQKVIISCEITHQNQSHEHAIFKIFAGGGMPPDPPSFSMLRMLVVLCTT